MMRSLTLLTFSIIAANAHAFTSLEAADALTGQARTIKVNDGSRVTAVVFISARCPCSLSHESLLKEMSAEFPEVSFVGIHANANESTEEAKAHFAKAALPFPVLHDAKAKIANEFRALKTPHVFVLDPQGEVVFSGGVTDSHDAPRASQNYLRAALLALRGGRKPEPKAVRTLGCVIARP